MGDLSENFSRSEFACKCGCGFDTADASLLDLLEDIRGHFCQPILITSGCRCPAHNKAVGGSKNSQHLYGRAADIAMEGVQPFEVAEYADMWMPNSGGVGCYTKHGFTHIDTRTNGPARWEG